MIIAWDIETCPLPEQAYSDAQRRRFEILLNQEMSKYPGLDREAASRNVRGLHPFLGWICCIAVVRADENGSPRDPVSFIAATPSEEGDLLKTLHATVALFRVPGIHNCDQRSSHPLILTFPS